MQDPISSELPLRRSMLVGSCIGAAGIAIKSNSRSLMNQSFRTPIDQGAVELKTADKSGISSHRNSPQKHSSTNVKSLRQSLPVMLPSHKKRINTE